MTIFHRVIQRRHPAARCPLELLIQGARGRRKDAGKIEKKEKKREESAKEATRHASRLSATFKDRLEKPGERRGWRAAPRSGKRGILRSLATGVRLSASLALPAPRDLFKKFLTSRGAGEKCGRTFISRINWLFAGVPRRFNEIYNYRAEFTRSRHASTRGNYGTRSFMEIRRGPCLRSDGISGFFFRSGLYLRRTNVSRDDLASAVSL